MFDDYAPSAASTQTRTDFTPVQIEIVGRSHPERIQLEHFIHQGFARLYGASVSHFFSQLISLYDTGNRLVAALGVQPADASPLVLEQYLDARVEEVFACTLGRSYARYTFVEVGNLAVARPGGARWLITALTAYLAGAGFDLAVFTAVPALRNAFARLGVELIALAEARRDRLPPGERAAWGRYYDSKPMVMVASVHQSSEALAQWMQTDADRNRLRGLWHSAFAAGLAHKNLRFPPPAMESARSGPAASDRAVR